MKLFKTVAFVVYPVTDIVRARSFYETTLGLSVTAQWENQWIEYDVGDGTLAITLADEKHRAGAHGATLALEAVDFDAVLIHFREKTVPIHEGPFDSPVCRGCVIRDPDGNEIIIHAKK